MLALYSKHNIGQVPAPKSLQSEKQHWEGAEKMVDKYKGKVCSG